MNKHQLLNLLTSKSNLRTFLVLAFVGFSTSMQGRETDTILDLWQSDPPGEVREVGLEEDFTKPTDKLIAGKRIIKLGNVSVPQIHIYRPEPSINTRAAVIICPGGGFNILAWDLEGTEVAEWLNSIGVTAAVLKYRVPTREQKPMWLSATQDAQRAIRLIRHHAESLQLAPDRVGILGFSAGGKAALMTTLATQASYPASDLADTQSASPDFTALIYTGGYIDDSGALSPENIINKQCTPIFMAHAFDDFVDVRGVMALSLLLKENSIPFEAHVYSEGGHGYGLRKTESPVTTWHHRFEDWLAINHWIGDSLR